MSPTPAHPKESCCTALSAAHTQNTVPGPLDLPLPHSPAHLHAHYQLHHPLQHPPPTYMPTTAPAPAPATSRPRPRPTSGVQHTPMRCRPRAPAAPACPCPRLTQPLQRTLESLRHHSFTAFTTIFSTWNSAPPTRAPAPQTCRRTSRHPPPAPIASAANGLQLHHHSRHALCHHHRPHDRLLHRFSPLFGSTHRYCHTRPPPRFPAPRPAARFPAYGIIDLAHMHFTIYYQLCPCHTPESQLPMTCRQSQPQSHAPPPRLRLHTPPREHTPSCKMTKPPLFLAQPGGAVPKSAVPFPSSPSPGPPSSPEATPHARG